MLYMYLVTVNARLLCITVLPNITPMFIARLFLTSEKNNNSRFRDPSMDFRRRLKWFNGLTV